MLEQYPAKESPPKEPTPRSPPGTSERKLLPARRASRPRHRNDESLSVKREVPAENCHSTVRFGQKKAEQCELNELPRAKSDNANFLLCGRPTKPREGGDYSQEASQSRSRRVHFFGEGASTCPTSGTAVESRSHGLRARSQGFAAAVARSPRKTRASSGGQPHLGEDDCLTRSPFSFQVSIFTRLHCQALPGVQAIKQVTSEGNGATQ